MSAGEKTLTYGPYTVEASSWDKTFFPKVGSTKGDLIRYSEEIAEVMLPHLKDRPLSFERYPDGVEAGGFFQKNTPDYFPDWIRTERLKKEGGHTEYTLADNTATLAYLANQACITVHAGLSRVGSVQNPCDLVIDLDPSGNDFKPVQTVAGRFKDFFEEKLDLTCFAKFTGSSGIHVVVPLKAEECFDEVRGFAGDLVEVMAETYPDDVTTEQRKNKRGSRVFLDINRNAYGQTAVAPYSVRAKPGAPVACPVDWEEALDSDADPQQVTLKNVLKRLEKKGDPWSDIRRHAVTLGPRRDFLRK